MYSFAALPRIHCELPTRRGAIVPGAGRQPPGRRAGLQSHHWMLLGQHDMRAVRLHTGAPAITGVWAGRSRPAGVCVTTRSPAMRTAPHVGASPSASERGRHTFHVIESPDVLAFSWSHICRCVVRQAEVVCISCQLTYRTSYFPASQIPTQLT